MGMRLRWGLQGSCCFYGDDIFYGDDNVFRAL